MITIKYVCTVSPGATIKVDIKVLTRRTLMAALQKPKCSGFPILAHGYLFIYLSSLYVLTSSLTALQHPFAPLPTTP
jgi:hypothetical protein